MTYYGTAGEVPLFLDSMWRGGGPHWDATRDIDPPDYNGQWSGAGDEMKHFAIDRHSGGSNALFMDGYSRKVPIKQLWDLSWHIGYPTERARSMNPSWWGPWLGKD